MNRDCFVGILTLLVSGAVVHAGESGVQAVDAAWKKAMKANSVDALVACYASDAVGWFPGETEAKGEKAIRALYEGMLGTVTIVDAATSDVHSKTAGNSSTGWGKFSITVVEKASGNTNVWVGRFTEVAEKRNGKWVYVVDHASIEPAPASPKR